MWQHNLMWALLSPLVQESCPVDRVTKVLLPTQIATLSWSLGSGRVIIESDNRILGPWSVCRCPYMKANESRTTAPTPTVAGPFLKHNMSSANLFTTGLCSEHTHLSIYFTPFRNLFSLF